MGDFKEYALVSGVPVYAKYDDEIKRYQDEIDSISDEGSKLYEIILDPKTSVDEKNKAKLKLIELNSKLEEIEIEKRKTESKKDAIDHLSPVFKGILKGEVIPSFSSYVKLASSDETTRELGRIEIQRKVLENEGRIIEKNIKGYEADLKVAKDNLAKEDLTEYQKLQFEKVVSDLNYK
ncbi:MAG: hypothetical protein ACP5TW_06480, partial [Thermoplasmata archaeon]